MGESQLNRSRSSFVAGCGLNVDRFAGFAIKAGQVALLPLRVMMSGLVGSTADW